MRCVRGSEALNFTTQASEAPAPAALARSSRAAATRGYLREVDFSHWAAGWLAEKLRGLTHTERRDHERSREITRDHARARLHREIAWHDAGERDAIALEDEWDADYSLASRRADEHVPKARGREALRDARGQGAAAVAERGARVSQAQRRGAESRLLSAHFGYSRLISVKLKGEAPNLG